MYLIWYTLFAIIQVIWLFHGGKKQLTNNKLLIVLHETNLLFHKQITNFKNVNNIINAEMWERFWLKFSSKNII